MKTLCHHNIAPVLSMLMGCFALPTQIGWEFPPELTLSLEPWGIRSSEIRSACSNIVMRDGSRILSHDFYYQYYLKNITCLTIIKAPEGMKIALIFDYKFDVEGPTPILKDAKCLDAIRVYNSANISNSTLLTPAGLCGYTKPQDLKSSSNILLLKWETKGVGTFEGFMISVVFFHERKCWPIKNEFVCRNGRCISNRHKCNGINSCGTNDTSDEEDGSCSSLTRLQKIQRWETQDSNRRIDELLQGHMGLILGGFLVFLLLLALIFIGCLCMCYIMICGLIRNREPEYSLYTFKRDSAKYDKKESIQSSDSQTGMVQDTTSAPKHIGKCSFLDNKIHISPTRRVTDPCGHRQSYKVSIQAPRRYTAPANISLIKNDDKRVLQLPPPLPEEHKLVDKKALTKGMDVDSDIFLAQSKLTSNESPKLTNIESPKVSDIESHKGEGILSTTPPTSITPPSSPINMLARIGSNKKILGPDLKKSDHLKTQNIEQVIKDLDKIVNDSGKVEKDPKNQDNMFKKDLPPVEKDPKYLDNTSKNDSAKIGKDFPKFASGTQDPKEEKQHLKDLLALSPKHKRKFSLPAMPASRDKKKGKSPPRPSL
ncbi:unnamed protein product [Gordionus sp. m RMFG-2023]|uniref:uncharacterized protein LOC135928187 n=1 Tax=Gordionus sp. m RMFG-2023 TaxID=3053472 RepID=UPI0030E1742C